MPNVRKKPELLVGAAGLIMAAGLLLWAGFGESAAMRAKGGDPTQGYTLQAEDPFAVPLETPPQSDANGIMSDAANPFGEGNAPGTQTHPSKSAELPDLPEAPQTSPGSATYATKPKTPSIVHLNSATSAQLQTLKGIGPAKAQAILDYRDAHGSFTDVQQLLDVKGIGPATLENILPYVVL